MEAYNDYFDEPDTSRVTGEPGTEITPEHKTDTATQYKTFAEENHEQVRRIIDALMERAFEEGPSTRRGRIWRGLKIG